MNWTKYALSLSLLSLSALSASATGSMQKNPPPKSDEETRNFYGTGEASYIYWLERRQNDAIFVSNYYSTPTDTPEKGSTAYAPVSAQSGFKVALGLKSVEHEVELNVQYTWFNNNNPKVGVFSYPGGHAYNKPAPTFTTASAGTISWNSMFQRIDFEFLNSLVYSNYFYVRPYINIVGAWDHETTTVASTNTNTDSVIETLDQHWWGVGPEIGFGTGYFFFRGEKNQVSLTSRFGVGQTWGPTNTTGLLTDTVLNKTVVSSQDNVTAVYTLAEVLFGLTYTYQDIEKNAQSFSLSVNWELQTWINNYSAFNGPLLSLQGLTLTLGAAF